jgi:hypothetical protein
VFDGHGGREAATYAEAHFMSHFLGSAEFAAGDIAAFTQAYITLDKAIVELAQKASLSLSLSLSPYFSSVPVLV